MSRDTLPDIVETIRIQAPPWVVWDFLVEPEYVPRWLGCLQYRKEVGHLFYMQPDPERRAAGRVEGATHCRVLQLEEPERFAFSWFLPGMPETRVTLTLSEADGGGTEVRLVHSGWDAFDAEAVADIRTALEGGWRSGVLPGLATVVEEELARDVG